MQNAHGKEIDLLRVTVKVPGKRPPRAVAPAGPSPAAPASSGINGLTKESAAAEATGTGTEDRFPSFHCLTDEQAKVSPRHKRLDGLLAEFLSSVGQFFALDSQAPTRRWQSGQFKSLRKKRHLGKWATMEADRQMKHETEKMTRWALTTKTSLGLELAIFMHTFGVDLTSIGAENILSLQSHGWLRSMAFLCREYPAHCSPRRFWSSAYQES